MPAGTPTTAPPRMPRPAEPAAQPTSAPAPTLAAVTAPSNAPAPARPNDAGPAPRAHRLRGAGRGAGTAARRQGPPRRPLLRRRDLPADGGASSGTRALADGERASGLQARPRPAGGRALDRRAAGVLRRRP